jgi:hypothetical protein
MDGTRGRLGKGTDADGPAGGGATKQGAAGKRNASTGDLYNCFSILLELHAYRSTMLSLCACGSISWGQEALLTNLRLTLNISTDESLVTHAVTFR